MQKRPSAQYPTAQAAIEKIAPSDSGVKFRMNAVMAVNLSYTEFVPIRHAPSLGLPKFSPCTRAKSRAAAKQSVSFVARLPAWPAILVHAADQVCSLFLHSFEEHDMRSRNYEDQEINEWRSGDRQQNMNNRGGGRQQQGGGRQGG
ncbi:MAG: hypothetical protein I8H71_13545, partial [Xanthomonadaceae bacterium]|nr:hypothetical protein [Xanthomonadaceae bacterium]